MVNITFPIAIMFYFFTVLVSLLYNAILYSSPLSTINILGQICPGLMGLCFEGVYQWFVVNDYIDCMGEAVVMKMF